MNLSAAHWGEMACALHSAFQVKNKLNGMVLVVLWLYLCVQDALWGIWGGDEEGRNIREESSAGKTENKGSGENVLWQKN